MNHSAVPDGARPLVGWRLWHAVEVPIELPTGLMPGHGRLYRLTGKRGGVSDWPPLIAAAARCGRKQSGHSRAPVEGCSCGFYALSSLPQFVASHWPAPGVVVGEVFLWGRVIVCERGYKAEHAYPKRLIVNRAFGNAVAELMSQELSASYSVPTEIKDWDELVLEAGLW
jgi:hypothetical protein